VPSADPALLQRIRAALSGGPPLRLAVLFGSRATGAARDDSDVDLGIIPCDPKLVLRDELGEASRLSGLLGLEIDLVRLDQDNPLLGREVALTGVCLFEAEPGMFSAYRATAMSCWYDFDDTIAPHRERFLRRLREGV
jgi:uncharacterized protein